MGQRCVFRKDWRVLMQSRLMRCSRVQGLAGLHLSQGRLSQGEQGCALRQQDQFVKVEIQGKQVHHLTVVCVELVDVSRRQHQGAVVRLHAVLQSSANARARLDADVSQGAGSQRCRCMRPALATACPVVDGQRGMHAEVQGRAGLRAEEGRHVQQARAG